MTVNIKDTTRDRSCHVFLLNYTGLEVPDGRIGSEVGLVAVHGLGGLAGQPAKEGGARAVLCKW